MTEEDHELLAYLDYWDRYGTPTTALFPAERDELAKLRKLKEAEEAGQKTATFSEEAP